MHVGLGASRHGAWRLRVVVAELVSSAAMSGDHRPRFSCLRALKIAAGGFSRCGREYKFVQQLNVLQRLACSRSREVHNMRHVAKLMERIGFQEDWSRGCMSSLAPSRQCATLRLCQRWCQNFESKQQFCVIEQRPPDERQCSISKSF
jgi:hypothetical protein